MSITDDTLTVLSSQLVVSDAPFASLLTEMQRVVRRSACLSASSVQGDDDDDGDDDAARTRSTPTPSSTKGAPSRAGGAPRPTWDDLEGLWQMTCEIMTKYPAVQKSEAVYEQLQTTTLMSGDPKHLAAQFQALTSTLSPGARRVFNVRQSLLSLRMRLAFTNIVPVDPIWRRRAIDNMMGALGVIREEPTGRRLP